MFIFFPSLVLDYEFFFFSAILCSTVAKRVLAASECHSEKIFHGKGRVLVSAGGEARFEP